MMKVKRIGLDLAKNIFQIHGVDIDEQTIVRQRLKRVAVLSYFARLDRVNGCVVGMEQQIRRRTALANQTRAC